MGGWRGAGIVLAVADVRNGTYEGGLGPFANLYLVYELYCLVINSLIVID